MSTTTTSTVTTRRPKWHPTPPPPPSPKILNLPRRTRRKQHRNTTKRLPTSGTDHHWRYRGKLESLFDQERLCSRRVPIVVLNERRVRVEEDDKDEEVCVERNGGFVEKWRFQAEILRAECNFLRMEREIALKKLERNRVQMERTLRSAVQTLIAGRKKIYEGKNVGAVLEEEIEELAEKLEELQRSSGLGNFEVRNCSNFDKKASQLQRRLEKIGGGPFDKNCKKEIQEVTETSFAQEINKESCNLGIKINENFTDVEILRRKMEGMSKGMLDRMEEEYGSMLSTTANSSVSSSASTSMRIELPDSSGVLVLQSSQEPLSSEENKCSGRCKAIVWRIVEQVRAETEQWSQMQDMLGQVRAEMEGLQASRDFWEDRALNSDFEIKSLRADVQEWRGRAIGSESVAYELQTEISVLQRELEMLKVVQSRGDSKEERMRTQDQPPVSTGKRVEKEKQRLIFHLKENHHADDRENKQEIVMEKLTVGANKEALVTKELPPISLGKQLERETRLLRRCFRENHHNDEKRSSSQDGPSCGRKKAQTHSSNGLEAVKRSPFQDIGNSSPLRRQNNKAVFPLHSPETSKTEENNL